MMIKKQLLEKGLDMKSEDKEALKTKIFSVDLGLKVLSLPSRLVSSTIAWSLSPMTRELKEDSYCSRLLVSKMEKKVEDEVLAKINRVELSTSAKEITLEGGIEAYLRSITPETMDKLIDKSYVEGFLKEVGQVLGFMFGKYSCRDFLVD